MPKYSAEAPDGSRIVVEGTETPEGVVFYADMGPTLGRVRIDPGQVTADTVRFADSGATLGRERLVSGGPPVLVDTPALLVEGLITATAAVGQTLSVTSGNWTGEPTSYEYQWQSDVSADLGSSDTYVVLASDAGTSITCIVQASNVAGSTAAPPSNAVSVPAGGTQARGGRRG